MKNWLKTFIFFYVLMGMSSLAYCGDYSTLLDLNSTGWRVALCQIYDKSMRFKIVTTPKVANAPTSIGKAKFYMSYTYNYLQDLEFECSDHEVVTYIPFNITSAQIAQFVEGPTYGLINQVFPSTHDVKITVEQDNDTVMWGIDGLYSDSTFNSSGTYNKEFNFVPDPDYDYFIVYDLGPCVYYSGVRTVVKLNETQILDVDLISHMQRKQEVGALKISPNFGVTNTIKIANTLQVNTYANVNTYLAARIKPCVVTANARHLKVGDNTNIEMDITYNEMTKYMSIYANGVIIYWGAPITYYSFKGNGNNSVVVNGYGTSGALRVTTPTIIVNTKNVLSDLVGELGLSGGKVLVVNDSGRYYEDNANNRAIINKILNSGNGVYFIGTIIAESKPLLSPLLQN